MRTARFAGDEGAGAAEITASSRMMSGIGAGAVRRRVTAHPLSLAALPRLEPSDAAPLLDLDARNEPQPGTGALGLHVTTLNARSQGAL